MIDIDINVITITAVRYKDKVMLTCETTSGLESATMVADSEDGIYGDLLELADQIK